jgi:hypothetical protein
MVFRVQYYQNLFEFFKIDIGGNGYLLKDPRLGLDDARNIPDCKPFREDTVEP